MSDPLLSTLAAPLRSVAKAAFTQVSRLYAERQAGREPANSPLMDSNLDRTLGLVVWRRG